MVSIIGELVIFVSTQLEFSWQQIVKLQTQVSLLTLPTMQFYN